MIASACLSAPNSSVVRSRTESQIVPSLAASRWARLKKLELWHKVACRTTGLLITSSEIQARPPRVMGIGTEARVRDETRLKQHQTGIGDVAADFVVDKRAVNSFLLANQDWLGTRVYHAITSA